MYKWFFKPDILYVKLWRNEIEIIDVEKGTSIREKSKRPFSSNWLLIADYEEAEFFFKNVIDKLKIDYKLKRFNSILVHPMELNENGISKVEIRIFLELFQMLGGRVVEIWDGEELSNKQVVRKLKN